MFVSALLTLQCSKLASPLVQDRVSQLSSRTVPRVAPSDIISRLEPRPHGAGSPEGSGSHDRYVLPRELDCDMYKVSSSSVWISCVVDASRPQGPPPGLIGAPAGRSCGEERADILHMTWTCDQMQMYQQSVTNKLQRNADFAIELSIKLGLLNLIPKPKKSLITFYCTLLGLVLAKCQIALHWPKLRSLALVPWEKDVLECAIAEELRLEMVMMDGELADDLNT
ncbi:hypothetical protein NDU88_001598 [Pleurodeles waltl]|uniref:Uncharacterized protein n=1 Tax=Pleurodeles waltl TaxID=8319 RepID=A0AAV7WPT8_PLEWA|nr:hypothetical protein NDU88_001598 [Pleurodeles waltl]